MTTDQTSHAIPTALSYTLSVPEAEGLAMQKVPGHFQGVESYQPSIVTAYRKYVQSLAGNIMDMDVHCPAIVPVCEAFAAYVQGCHFIPGTTDRFLAEWSSRQDTNISMPWLSKWIFSFASKASRVSKDEQEVLLQVMNPDLHPILEALNHGAIDRVDFQTLLNSPFTPMPTRYRFNYRLHPSVIKRVQDALTSYFPTPVFYTFPGKSKLGVSFLISRYLENVFPLGLPRPDQANTIAHGVKLSQLGFFIHDIFHAHLDGRLEALEENIYAKTAQYVERGGAALRFIDWYTPHAVQNYSALMRGLSFVQEMFQSRLLPHFGGKEFNQAMVGFFWLLHEQSHFYREMFDNNDLGDVISRLVKDSQTTLQSKNAWESPDDPLKTSPVNGVSTWSDQKIIRHFIKHDLECDPCLSKETFIQSVHRWVVRRTERFINLEIELKSGEIIRHGYPTLRHKWDNVDDNMALLRMAGIIVRKPTISNLALLDSRSLVQTTLGDVQGKLKALLEQFKTRAIYFINTPNHDSPSFGDRYFTWQFKHSQSLKDTVDHSLKQQGSKLKC